MAERDVTEGFGPARWLYGQPYVLITLAMLFWAANMLVAKAASETVPPVALAQMRWTLAFLILLPFAMPYLRTDWPILRRNLRILALLGILGITLYNTLTYVALGSTTAINATMLASIFPMMIAAVGFVLYRDRLTPMQGVGIVVACVGALTILSRGDIANVLAMHFNPGDLWIIAAQVTYAAYTVLLRERPAIHPITFLTVTVFFGQLVQLPITFGEAYAGASVTWAWSTLATVVFLAVFPSILAFSCFNRAVELMGSNRAAPFFHLVPVFSSIGAVWFLGEKVALYHLIGWPLIVAGIATTQIGRRR